MSLLLSYNSRLGLFSGNKNILESYVNEEMKHKSVIETIILDSKKNIHIHIKKTTKKIDKKEQEDLVKKNDAILKK